VSSPALTIANDEKMGQLIRSAQRRVVFIAPAVTSAVAEALVRSLKTLGPDGVSIVVDIDPEVYRLGYGDESALALLQAAASAAGTTVNYQRGVRLGVLIADDKTLVFSPTPRLIEAGPRDPTALNAIVLGPPPESVAAAIGIGPNGRRDQVIGLDPVTRPLAEDLKKNLADNPPQRFDVARTMRVFNAQIEFVEFEVSGIHIQRRRVPIPAKLMGLAADDKTRKLVESTFKLISDDSPISGKHFDEKRRRLKESFLIDLPGFGQVILRSKKPALENAVKTFASEVDTFSKEVESQLEAEMNANRARLVAVLLPLVKSNVPPAWNSYYPDPLTDDQLRGMLDLDLKAIFGAAKDQTTRMKVELVFKGVTYESLTDPKFVKLALKHIPVLQQLHAEFDASKAEDPFP